MLRLMSQRLPIRNRELGRTSLTGRGWQPAPLYPRNSTRDDGLSLQWMGGRFACNSTGFYDLSPPRAFPLYTSQREQYNGPRKWPPIPQNQDGFGRRMRDGGPLSGE